MKRDIHLIAEISIAVALSMVLNMIPLWRMPQGGSVSLEMLPILLIALRRGVKAGMFTGLTHGFLQLAFGASIFHPVQVFLDYPVAYLLLGLAGIFSSKIYTADKKINYTLVIIAVLIGSLARFFSHFISGIIFFGHFAPEGQSEWLYSLIYNGSFMLPSIIICLLLAIPILRILKENNI